MGKTHTVVLTIFISFLIFSFFSCQTFPSGLTLEEIQASNISDTGTGLSTLDVYRYFTMCRVVWRVRDGWRETGWGLDYILDEKTNTLALVILEDGILHIAFRSSQALEEGTDLKYNSRFGLRSVTFLSGNSGNFGNTSRIRAHGGFLTKYVGIRDELIRRVEDAEVSRVVLVGHSGGGAMASIAFLDLKHQFPDRELDAVVFGPVRTFNRHGAAWFEEHEENFIRIVNGRDPFSSLPPSIFGYRHIGRLVRIGRRPFYKLFSFKDHHPGYRTVLEEMLREEGIEPSDLEYY